MKNLLIFIILLFCITNINLEVHPLKEKKDVPIRVTIDGEVNNPGTYDLDPYASMEELLLLANPNDQADLSSINEQTILKDKDKVIIPAKPEMNNHKISINLGTIDDLCLLPGIGKQTASRIIEYRETNGLFQSLEDLKEVKGIGESKFNKIKDLISL